MRALSTSAQSLQHSPGFGFKSGFGFGFWFGFGFGFEFGSGFVFVFGSGLGLSRGFWHGQHWLTEGLSPVTSCPARTHAHLRGRESPPSARCSRQSSQQLDRQIFTSEVFLLSSATELLFFSYVLFFLHIFLLIFFSLLDSLRALSYSPNPKHIRILN